MLSLLLLLSLPLHDFFSALRVHTSPLLSSPTKLSLNSAVSDGFLQMSDSFPASTGTSMVVAATTASSEIADLHRKIFALEQQLDWERVQRRRLIQSADALVQTVNRVRDEAYDVDSKHNEWNGDDRADMLMNRIERLAPDELKLAVQTALGPSVGVLRAAIMCAIGNGGGGVGLPILSLIEVITEYAMPFTPHITRYDHQPV